MFLAKWLLSIALLSTIQVHVLSSTSEKLLSLVNDEDLLSLIRSEKYLITLFSKRDCSTCLEYENIVKKIISNDDHNLAEAIFVKVEDSQVRRLYSVDKEPVLVFFRHGVPLLYDGPLDTNLILHIFSDNLNPLVKELNDETFEHLTQASTGATTGDWFILFYSNDCIDCQRMQARLEAVGVQLKNRVNVARVNIHAGGSSTAKRFKVTTVPTFILFRHGRLYRYMFQKYDISSLTSFAQDWYKNATPENVPHPQTPFDLIVSAAVSYLEQNPWILSLGAGALTVGILASAIFLRLKQKVAQVSGTKEKKTKKTK